MGGKKDDINETPQQRALTEQAVNQFADWKRRWLPVQKNLINQIQTMGAPGSREREAAKGRASTDNAIAFGKAQGALEKTLSGAGVNAGSSRFKLAETGIGEDQATSRGLGAMLSEQQMNDAYVQGLQAITAMGRGERAQVADSLTQQARSSSRQAAADAESSALERAGNANLVGTVAGVGLQQMLSPASAASGPTGSIPGGYNVDGRQFNNPSAFTALEG